VLGERIPEKSKRKKSMNQKQKREVLDSAAVQFIGGWKPGRIGSQPRRYSSVLHLQPGRRFTLTATAGPDTGKVFEIDRARVVIGRTNGEIVLSDSEASRNHAALEFDGEVVRLVDLGSTNGTFVGGERIESIRLGNYGEFQVGNTTLMLTITDVYLPGLRASAGSARSSL
jgi:hypothetical protein